MVIATGVVGKCNSRWQEANKKIANTPQVIKFLILPGPLSGKVNIDKALPLVVRDTKMTDVWGHLMVNQIQESQISHNREN